MLLKLLNKKPIESYVILAYLITWLCWIPTIIIAQEGGYLLPAAANYAELIQEGFGNPEHLIISTIFFLAVFGPLLAAMIVTAYGQGRSGLSQLLASILNWRIQRKWFVIVVSINLLLLSLTIIFSLLTGLLSLSQLQFAPIGYLMFIFIVQIVSSGLGEEPGWRGFLFPRLQEKYSAERSVWYMGIIWAVWHYPFVILFSFSALTTPISLATISSLLFGLGGFTLTIIGMSFIYAWIYSHTRSLFLAILFHALNNVIPFVLIGGLEVSTNIVLAISPWIFVFFMERRYGRSWYISDAR